MKGWSYKTNGGALVSPESPGFHPCHPLADTHLSSGLPNNVGVFKYITAANKLYSWEKEKESIHIPSAAWVHDYNSFEAWNFYFINILSKWVKSKKSPYLAFFHSYMEKIYSKLLENKFTLIF